MSHPQLIDKLTQFLDSHLPLSEECHVVYLLVEIRKLLDRDNNSAYPLLRFYCDWCVHTKKDRITPQIKTIMKQIYSDMLDWSTNKPMAGKPKIVSFMYFEDVQVETQSFLAEYGFSTLLTDTEENWIGFISLLVSVLADQPIISPTDDIQEFCFLPASPRCVSGIVIFTNSMVFKNGTRSMDQYVFANYPY